MKENCTIIGLGLGVMMSIAAIAYVWYLILRGGGDGIETASWILFIFGLPMSILEMPLELFGVVWNPYISLGSLSVLFFLNWILIGSICGYIIGKKFF